MPAQGWTHAVAGASAGSISVLVNHPLDVVKTRLQVQDGQSFAQSQLPRYNGTWHALKTIARTEGLRGLYAGLTPSLLGSTLSWGAYFYSYNAAKARYRAWFPEHADNPTVHLLSGLEAGTIVTLLTNPIWVLKTRLALQHAGSPPSSSHTVSPHSPPPKHSPAIDSTRSVSSAAAVSSTGGLVGRSLGAARQASGAAPAAAGPPPRNYTGTLDAIRRIVREEGLGALYKGLLPSLLLVSHGAVQFMVYEQMKLSLVALHHHAILPSPPAEPAPSAPGPPPQGLPPDVRLWSVEYAAMGGGSKMAASVLTYPSQVVRARQQQRTHGHPSAPPAHRYASTWGTFRWIVRHEGMAGLYKGLVPQLIKVVPASAVTFVVYEAVTHSFS